MQSNLSDKISRSDNYTKIVNYSSLGEIITKWIDMRYITFTQRHLASTQSQSKVKGIAKSISNSVVYFSNYFYIRMNLFWNCFLPIKSHGSRYNIYLKAKCRLFLNNSFTPERMIYEVVLTFESADEIRWCDHLNEISLAVLSHGTVYLVCSSNF